MGWASRHHHDGPGQVDGAPGGHALPADQSHQVGRDLRARRRSPTHVPVALPERPLTKCH